MKKFIIILLGLFLVLPITASAYDTTDQLYIDIKIQEDGSIFVREIASLDGRGSSNKYNGRLRSINYRNNMGNNSIYDGSKIHSIKVYDIKDKKLSFDSMNRLNNEFEKVTSASKGEYGVYTLRTNSNGVDFTIYNPSSKDTAFYIEYVIDDVVISHDDVAEFAWTVLGREYEENIDDFKVRVTLPREDSGMRVWLNGPLNGEVTRTSNSEINVTYDFLGAYNAVDIRMVFNKELVPMATKTSVGNALENIIAEEQEKADKANEERNKIRFQNNSVIAATVVWYIVLGVVLAYYYIKYDREEKVNFNAQYYRDFPGTYGPEILEFLLKYNVTPDGFSASILQLISMGVIKVEDDPKDKKNYTLVYQEERANNLTDSEKQVIDILFNFIGQENHVKLKQIKNCGKSYSNAQVFIKKYNEWEADAKSAGKGKNFYCHGKGKAIPILISLLGIIIFMLNVTLETGFFLGYIAFVVMIAVIIYVSVSKKKTKEGALEYQKWMAFKRFLLDFGRMDEKQLPEVAMWDKYLVYATVLGCAKQLEKDMKIRIETMENVGVDSMDVFYMNHFAMNMALRNTLASTINSSVTQAVSSSRASIAASTNSSGGGFGGGASMGGGSFGGGGGGGRF